MYMQKLQVKINVGLTVSILKINIDPVYMGKMLKKNHNWFLNFAFL